MNIKVIDKNFKKFVDVSLKHFCHGSWKGASGILHVEEHNILVKQPKFGD